MPVLGGFIWFHGEFPSQTFMLLGASSFGLTLSFLLTNLLILRARRLEEMPRKDFRNVLDAVFCHAQDTNFD